MADSTPMGMINKIASLVVTFIYRLTVRLAVEFLKLGCILGMLLFFGGSVVLFMTWTGWTVYTSSGGNIPATIIALLGAVVLVACAGMLVQYVMKDVLRLTDMTLVEIFKFLVGVFIKQLKGGNANAQDIVSQEPEVDAVTTTSATRQKSE